MNWENFAQAATTSATNLLGGLAQTALGSELGYKNSKKLMKEQYKYAVDAWNKQNERQDWLSQNQMRLTKEGLRNAGYSTADPYGIGQSNAAVNSLETPDSSGSFAPGSGSRLLSYGELKQGELVDAQKEYYQALGEKLKSETEGQNIHNHLLDTFGAQQWQSAIANLDASTKKMVEEAIYTNQKTINDLQLNDAIIDNISQRLEMDWQRLPLDLKIASATVYELQERGDLHKADAAKDYEQIKEIGQQIDNLKKEYELTDGQIEVARQLGEKYAKEAKSKGYEITSKKAHAEMDQLERDIMKSMGKTYYQAKNIAALIIPWVGLGVRLNTRK